MKRAGFTMIELIFVIVILGILAAVALPKMAGVQEQARAAKAGELVAQLNSVVVPIVWGKAQIAGGGTVASLATADAVITDFIEIPSNFTINTTNFASNSLASVTTANCSASAVNANSNCVLLSDTTNSIYVHFRDGNLTDAPRFWYTQKTSFSAGNEYNVSKASF